MDHVYLCLIQYRPERNLIAKNGNIRQVKMFRKEPKTKLQKKFIIYQYKNDLQVKDGVFLDVKNVLNYYKIIVFVWVWVLYCNLVL